MSDIWFTRFDNPTPGGYRQFMPVDVTEDGIADTCTEALRRFYLLRFPGVPAARVRKYLEPIMEPSGEVTAEGEPILRETSRRRWILRGASITSAARNKLLSTGSLTIRVGTYAGPFDLTWIQVRQFLRDNVTGLNESGGL